MINRHHAHVERNNITSFSAKKPSLCAPLKIIGGAFKGRSIMFYAAQGTRPPQHRVRESIFNILHHRFHIKPKRILDLFAGSGSYGFEAISRYDDNDSCRVTFVEQAPHAAEWIIANANTLGCAERITLCRQGVAVFLRMSHRALEVASLHTYDLVFLDPPYHTDQMVCSLEQLQKSPYVHAQTMVVLKTERLENIPDGWVTLLYRKISWHHIYFLALRGVDGF